MTTVETRTARNPRATRHLSRAGRGAAGGTAAAQSRDAARPQLGARRARQPQRRRASRRHDSHAPLDQDRVAGGMAAARDHADGPHHAARRRHAGARAPALRQGAPSGRDPTCSSALGHAATLPACTRRRGLRLSRLCEDGGRGTRRKRDSGGRGVDRISRRTVADEDAPRRDRGVGGRRRGRDRHRHHAGARAHRQLAGALRRSPRLSRSLRLRASQGDSRHRRARTLQGRGARIAGGDDGGRRLHQDEHRQGERQRDPAGGHRDGARHSRLPRAHRLSTSASSRPAGSAPPSSRSTGSR